MSEKIRATNMPLNAVQKHDKDGTTGDLSTKKMFIEPEIKEYPSLKEVTLLTVPAVSGSTFFKTFK
ncbi:MAG: hypothetical protein ACP5JP_09425 [bacterium]